MAHTPPVRARMDGNEELPLTENWEVASCPPDTHIAPNTVGKLAWLPARVPGTAASALADAGHWSAGDTGHWSGGDTDQWNAGDTRDFDAEDWWFRTRFSAAAPVAGETVSLELDGIATVSEVFLNGERLLASETMFAAYSLDVGALLAGENELAIRCRALAPLLDQRRKPRARWRTRLVAGNLRFFRTMLLGRAPGFAPGPAAVGPWRPVRLVRRRTIVIDELELRTTVVGRGPDLLGLLSVCTWLRPLDASPVEAVDIELCGPSGTHRAALALAPSGDGDGDGDGGTTNTIASGMLKVKDVARWWPHTHGDPALYEVRLHIETGAGTVTADGGRVGFRTLAPSTDPEHDIEVDGLDLHINDVRVFARGAVWTPPNPVGLAPKPQELRARLEQARDAGMNMLRIPGTSAYESPAFHDLCDELGLLVWQDFMFANLDYPIADEHFRDAVEREARALLGELAGRPSLAVLCGNSEIEQQVAMLGLDPTLGRGELFGKLLPELVAEANTEALYVPSSPCGGELPFRPDRGIANYYGVGGYRRPLEDARRAEVRFAGECLAFSNVPNEAGVEAVAPKDPAYAVVHHPCWKAGVPRDAGSGWDFEDVRDHYLQSLFGVEPSELRRVDHERYLELSRAVTGEAMAEVFGEWRRSGSPCGGGMVLWLADLAPGAGWGVVDHSGAPKPAYHHLRRAFAPTAVWMTDEGLGGIRVHIANDRATPLTAKLRVALYRDGEQRVQEAGETLELSAHDTCERDVEALLGRFADASWSYRFGPPGHDVVVATLESKDAVDGLDPISQAFRFPAGRPLRPQTAGELGLEGTLRLRLGRPPVLTLRSRRLAYGVRLHLPGFDPTDDALTLEPGVARHIELTPAGSCEQSPDDSHKQSPGGRHEQSPAGSHEQPPAGMLTALNLRGRVPVAVEEQQA